MWGSLRFRIVLGSLIGYLIASTASLLALSHALTRDLLERTDWSLQTEILEVASTVAGLGSQPTDESLSETLARYGHMHGIGSSYFRVYSPQGHVLGHSSLDLWPNLTPPVSIGDLDLDKQIFSFDTRHTPQHQHGVRVIYYVDENDRVFEHGMDLRETKAFLREVRLAVVAAFCSILVFGAALGIWLTGRVLKSVSAVSRTARRLTENLDLSQRVAVPTGSRETDQLATAFNTMVEQIAALVQSQKGIMNNIAHDIRSPVARMRAAAEAALNQDQSGVAGRVIESCDQILSLVNTLLEISETEAGTQVWDIETFDLSDMVGQGIELFQPVAESKDLDLTCTCDRECIIQADRRVLQRLIANLVDNAIKFTPPGGRITVNVSKTEDEIRVDVIDTGCGIPEADLPHVFDRFFRGDASRSTVGNGLGLSFCYAAIEAMGGNITCQSQEGKGTNFHIVLPREAKRPLRVPTD